MAQLAGEQVHSRPALPCAAARLCDAPQKESLAKGEAASTEGVNPCRQDRAFVLFTPLVHS
jgi:hypothetical protein